MEWMTGPPKAQMYRKSCKKSKFWQTFDGNTRDCYLFSLKMMQLAQKRVSSRWPLRSHQDDIG